MQKIAKKSPSANHRTTLSGYNIVKFLVAEIDLVVWGTPSNFNGFRVLAALLHGSQVVRQPHFAALNRGRHLCSAGRRSGWALAHILAIFLEQGSDDLHVVTIQLLPPPPNHLLLR